MSASRCSPARRFTTRSPCRGRSRRRIRRVRSSGAAGIRRCLPTSASTNPPSTSSSSARARTRSARSSTRLHRAASRVARRSRIVAAAAAISTTFPAHDYSLIPVERYFALKGKRQIDYISSQGCRFRCAFCADPAVFARGWTGLAPERIADEVAHLHRRYRHGRPRVSGRDLLHARAARRRAGRTSSCAATCRSRGRRRCAPIRRAGWATTLFAKAVRSGLRRVMVGVESGSQEMLDRLKKDMQLEQVRDDRGDVRAPRRRRHLQLHRRVPGRARSRACRRRSRWPRRCGRSNPAFETPIFYYRPYPGNPMADAVRAQRLRVPARPRGSGPTSITSAAAGRGSRAEQWRTRRALQVLHAARVAAGRVALAAARRVALALRSRLVRVAGREGARRLDASAAAGVVMDLLLAHGYFLSLDAEEQRIMRPHPPLGAAVPVVASQGARHRRRRVRRHVPIARAISPTRSSASGRRSSALPST